MAATLPQVIDLPRTIDGFVPHDVRLYVLRLLFMAGGEYSEQELASKFNVSEDTIHRNIIELQTCVHYRLPLEDREVRERRWRIMPNNCA
jgi:predicted DNA-binding transcriptional regulator YafY